MIVVWVESANFAAGIFRSDSYVEILPLFLFMFSLFPVLGNRPATCMTDKPDVSLAAESAACADLYRSMQLEGVVSWKAFRQAVTGYHKIAGRKRDVLTLIDFHVLLPRSVFRIRYEAAQAAFLIGRLARKNSGDKYATSFSNEYGSYKSSLGFYLTETTYQGRNGYSLILNGLEKVLTTVPASVPLWYMELLMPILRLQAGEGVWDGVSVVRLFRKTQPPYYRRH